MTIDERKCLGYCRPHKEKQICVRCDGVIMCVVGLKPTQRWHILGINNHRWILKRHNIVISVDFDEFLKYFYRTDK